MDKRGDLSSGQLVMLILAIAGFALAALFLFGVFKNESLTERELCRLSILSRATVPGIAQDAVPLNCFTEKVCITTKDNSLFSGAAIFGNGKSDCKQFAGEENVRDVEVKINSDLGDQRKTLEIIQREVANSMFDCWAMTGQGKLDIFKGTPPGSVIDKALTVGASWADISIEAIKPTCLVCSRIAFSDALLEADKKTPFLKTIDYNNFMSREKVPGSSLTYFQAFTDESVGAGYGVIEQSENKLAEYIKKESLNNEDLDKVRIILIEQVKTDEEKNKIKKLTYIDLQKILNQMKTKSSSQVAVVFTQIKVSNADETDQFWSTFRNGAILSGTVGFSGPGKVLNLLGFTPLSKFLTYVIGIGGVSTYLAFEAEAQTHANQALSAATCGKFESNVPGGEQKGCSLVKLVNWDVNTINTLCSGSIEGNL